MRTKNQWIYFLLLLIILLGATLRFYDLTGESLWTDEMVSLTHVRRETTLALIHSVAERELMPAGYFLYLSYWVELFGESEFSLRLPSLLFDLGSIILIFLLGAKLFRGKRGLKVGLLSSLFYSTVMLQVLYAQEARPYSLFTFMVLLSTLIFVHFFKKRNLSLFWIYTGVTALALQINYMAFFLIFFHLLAVIFSSSQKEFLKVHLLSILSVLILFLPQVSVLIRQVQLRQSFLQQFFHSLGLPFFLSRLGLFFYLIPVISLSLIIIFGVIIFKKKKDFFSHYFSERNIFPVVVFLLLIAGTVHLLFLDKTLRSFTLIRHSFFVVPFFYLFAARGLVNFSANFKKSSISILVVVGILVFNAFTLNTYYQTVSKPPWQEAVLFIEENSDDSPLLLFARGGSNIDLYDYYSRKDWRAIDLTGVSNTSLDDFLQQLNREEGFWLVSSRIRIEVHDYKALFDEKFELGLEKSYPELSIYLYYT